jgi:bifunctional aspartokinase / homoserine dehydrogenase 1
MTHLKKHLNSSSDFVGPADRRPSWGVVSGIRGSADGLGSAEPFEVSVPRPIGRSPEAIARTSRFSAATFPHGRQSHRRISKPIHVLKFGGTSVGEVSAILKTIDVIQTAATTSGVVVVVSAMSGVTNKLLEAARCSEAGDRKAVCSILEALRNQHALTVNALVDSGEERGKLLNKIAALLEECDQFCQGTTFLRELTPRTRDAISSLGERLIVPVLSAALRERGLSSTFIEASDLFVTNSNHGAAEPLMEPTAQRCQAALLPLLHQGVVPVVTGFIGATESGVLTTLGRGGSDYSATILGAALEADEVSIWTDVDGVLTADPRLVPDATTVPEISYHEAAELGYFGAKVLHPKTLRPLMHAGIPVWIRNTFSPQGVGTKITPDGSSRTQGVKALTATSDVVLITVGGPGIVGSTDVLSRTFGITAAVEADVLLVSQSSSQNDICFVVPSSCAKKAVEALRREFAQDLKRENVEHINVDTNVAIVAAVGQNMRGMPGIAGRTFGVLGQESVNVMAIAQGSSECSISFLLAAKDMKTALLAIHREFRLDTVDATASAAVC